MSTCGPKVGIADFDKQEFFVNCGQKKVDALEVQNGDSFVCGQVVLYNSTDKSVVPGPLTVPADANQHYAISVSTLTASADDKMDFYTWAHDVNIDALTFTGLTEAQLMQELINDGDKIRAVRPSHGGAA